MMRVVSLTVLCSAACGLMLLFASSIGRCGTPTWHMVSSTGPTPGPGAMAYDVAHGRVVLFRGSETWEWDGARWTRKAETGPSARSSFAMTYDAARQRVLLFGGQFNGNLYRDTWEWDGATWTKRADTGPSPRSGHAMAYDTARQRV